MPILTRPLPDSPLVRERGYSGLSSTLGETVGAAFGADTLGDLLGRGGDIQAANRIGVGRGYARLSEETKAQRRDERLTSADTLNERYGDLGLKFDRPMSDEAAGIIAEAKKGERRRADIITRGPQGFTATAAQLGAGFAAMAVDPVEVATAFIPVLGPGARAYFAAQAGRVGGAILAEGIEGAVGNALTEPLVYGLSRSQQLDYEMTDALMSVGLGAALGGAAGALRGVRGIAIERRTEALMRRREAEFQPRPRDQNPSVDSARAAAEPPLRYDPAAARKVLAEVATGRKIDIEADLNAERAAIMAEAAPLRRPTVEFLRGLGGVDPSGKLAEELRASGVTTRSAPGLYRRGGLMDADNIPVDEHPRMQELIAATPDADGGSRYFSPQAIATRIVEETSGAAQDPRAARLAEIDRIADKRREIAADLEPFGITDATPEELDATARIMAETGAEAVDAFEGAVLAAERDRVTMAAERAQDPRYDSLADFDESAAAQRLADEPVDLFAEDAFLMAKLDELRAAGLVTRAQEDALAEVEAFAARGTAFGNAAKAAAACLLR